MDKLDEKIIKVWELGTGKSYSWKYVKEGLEGLVSIFSSKISKNLT